MRDNHTTYGQRSGGIYIQQARFNSITVILIMVCRDQASAKCTVHGKSKHYERKGKKWLFQIVQEENSYAQLNLNFLDIEVWIKVVAFKNTPNNALEVNRLHQRPFYCHWIPEVLLHKAKTIKWRINRSLLEAFYWFCNKSSLYNENHQKFYY